MWIITLLIIIAGLSYIFYNSDKEEGHIILKLIGYYFLGAFLFRFNEIPIPLGFIIFLIFLKPMVNKVAKTRAAYLGLLLAIISIVSPMIGNYYFQRPVRVVASSSNIYMLDIKEDGQMIQEKLGHPRNLKINRFDVSYNEDGEIKDYICDLVGYLENDMILYRVELLPDKQVYKISARKIDKWLTFERLVLADRFFEVLEKVNLKEVVNQERVLEWYVVTSRGEYRTGSLVNATNFLFKDDEMVRMDNSDLPISGFYISLFGMRKNSTDGYSSRCYMYYWFQ